MRTVLCKSIFACASAVAFCLAASTTEAATFPRAPSGHSISPEVGALVREAQQVAYDLDEAPCGWIRRNGTLERYRSIQARLKAAYNRETRPAMRDYIDGVGSWLYDSRENFFEDEFFLYCERAYYAQYGKTPVLPGYSYQDRAPPLLKIGGGFTGGALYLPEFSSALQLESGGNIIDSRFGAVSRKDDYLGFAIKGVLPNRNGGPYNAAIFGYSYGTATNNTVLGALSTGGANLNILSPQGPAGNLGGGVSVNGAGGFANVTDLRYADNYAEHLGYLGLRFNGYRLPATGTKLSPYVQLLFGYVDESSNYAGTSAAGTLDFQYVNKLEMWRYGTELGMNIRQPILDNGVSVGLYANAAARLIYNDAYATSTLNLTGVVNASETADASADKFDVGFVGGGGIYARSGNAVLSGGVFYETWQVPVLMYSNTAPVAIDFQSRESVTAKVSYTYRFAPAPQRGFLPN